MAEWHSPVWDPETLKKKVLGSNPTSVPGDWKPCLISAAGQQLVGRVCCCGSPKKTEQQQEFHRALFINIKAFVDFD
jgi:hypothetical protein